MYKFFLSNFHTKIRFFIFDFVWMICLLSYIVFICYYIKCFCINLKKIYISRNDFTSKRKIYFQCQHVEWHYDELFANDAHSNNKITMIKREISTSDDNHTHWNNNNHIIIHFFKFITQKTKNTIVQNWIIWWKKKTLETAG